LLVTSQRHENTHQSLRGNMQIRIFIYSVLT
jgi:hypothetical protein